MRKRTIAFSLAAIYILCGAPGAECRTTNKLGTGLSVTGSQTLTYRRISVKGNYDVFAEDNYLNSERFYDETNLTVTGKLYGNLSLDATWSRNRWNPNDRTLKLGYQGSRTLFEIGDINASLSGNELVSFRKRLQGVNLKHKAGSLTFTGIASRTKAATRTIQIRGNNTPGPYYLNASQIIDGSERVKIDETEIPRTDASGTANYSLDPFSGILTFRDGLIVPETSSIVVSFETRSPYASEGTIWGARTDIPLGSTANLGITYLAQSSRDEGAAQLLIERIPGGNSPGSPYWLRYIPDETKPVTVKVDGILQRPQLLDANGEPLPGQGEYDYTINYPLHYILFTRLIPPTSTITVTYFPRQEKTVSGDRSVFGLDSSWKVSEKLSLVGQFARTADSATALKFRTEGNFGKLTLSAGLRNIDPSYASIDTVGFQRNDRGTDLRMDYRFSSRLRLFSSYDRYRRPSYGYGSISGSDSIPILSGANLVSGLVMTLPKGPEMTMSRTVLRNAGFGGTAVGQIDSTLTTDAFNLRWNRGKTVFTGELNKTAYTDREHPEYASMANTRKVGLQYLPGERLSLSADYATSDVDGAGGSSSRAASGQVTANWMPFSKFSLSANYRVSDSGGNYAPYDGTYIQPTSSYSGGYFGGAYVGGTFGFGSSYGGKTVSRTLTAHYTPFQFMTVDSSLTYSYTAGDNATNTSSMGRDFSIMANPWSWLQFSAHLSFQDMDYIGSFGGMKSRIGFCRMVVGPLAGFTLDLNYQDVSSDSMISSIFDPFLNGQQASTSLKGWTAELSRRLGSGRRAFLQYQISDASGIIANSKSTWAVGLEFPVNEILGLTLDWRITRYADRLDPLNNYSANSINAQLGARFW